MKIQAKWQEAFFGQKLDSGEDVLLPMAYWARIDDAETPYVIELDVQVSPLGEPRCTHFKAEQRPDGDVVTPEGLRRVRLSDLLAASLGYVVHKKKIEADGTYRIIPPSEHGDWRKLRAPRRRHTLTDDFLRRVADIYREAYERGDAPVVAVAGELHGSRSSAARWVQQSRRRGFLQPTKPRQAGV